MGWKIIMSLLKKKNKIPKQFYHWLNKFNIYPLYSPCKWTRGRICSFKGRGRYWRITNRYTFQSSKEYSYFDRWAISICAEISFPMTKIELLHFIENLQLYYYE